MCVGVEAFLVEERDARAEGKEASERWTSECVNVEGI